MGEPVRLAVPQVRDPARESREGRRDRTGVVALLDAAAGGGLGAEDAQPYDRGRPVGVQGLQPKRKAPFAVNDPEFRDLPMPIPMMVSGTLARVVLLANSLEQLMDRDYRQQGYEVLLASVRRRGLTPRGSGWMMCLSFPDDPDWRQSIVPSLVETIEAKMATMDEVHLLVLAIADSADLRPKALGGD